MQVNSHPARFDDNQAGCEIPEMAHGGHQAPVPTNLAAFTIVHGPTGALATTFLPGVFYTVSVPSYTSASNAWVHADAGVTRRPVCFGCICANGTAKRHKERSLIGTGHELPIGAYSAVPRWCAGNFTGPTGAIGRVAKCDRAWFSLGPAQTHNMTWVAPADVSSCVMLSAAQSASATDAYHTFSVRTLLPVSRDTWWQRTKCLGELSGGNLIMAGLCRASIGS